MKLWVDLNILLQSDKVKMLENIQVLLIPKLKIF